MNVLAENKKARFDYETLETFEAGIELLGQEVKSIRDGRMQLAGSYGIIRDNEIWLLNAQIPPHQPKNASDEYDPSRTRRLLLHRKEIKSLIGKLNEKGLSLIPMTAFEKKGLVKISLSLCRSRKAHDKRDLLKKRTVQREMERRD